MKGDIHMNGELYQICSIVAAAKYALYNNETINYVPSPYEGHIEFRFLPEKRLFKNKQNIANDVNEWYALCKQKNLQDIKMLAPLTSTELSVLGFSNTSQGMILCFFHNRMVTYFVADWQFDTIKNSWNIVYNEVLWENPPSEKPQFENNIETFKTTLQRIADLATTIECNSFADIFQEAMSILQHDEQTNALLPMLPNLHKTLFAAVNRADVFGAMGSWNDTPPYMAHEKGMDEDYQKLSKELFENLRMAMLFAINEW